MIKYTNIVSAHVNYALRLHLVFYDKLQYNERHFQGFLVSMVMKQVSFSRSKCESPVMVMVVPSLTTICNRNIFN